MMTTAAASRRRHGGQAGLGGGGAPPRPVHHAASANGPLDHSGKRHDTDDPVVIIRWGGTMTPIL